MKKYDQKLGSKTVDYWVFTKVWISVKKKISGMDKLFINYIRSRHNVRG